MRRNIFAQILAVGATCGIFFIDRLPDMVVGMRVLGHPFTSWPEARDLTVTIMGELFPTVGECLMCALGVMGLLLPARSERFRLVRRLSAATLIFTVIHVLLARRYPYSRTFGYFFPLVLLGFGNLVAFVLSRTSRSAWRITIWAALAFTVIFLLAPSIQITPREPEVEEMIAVARSIQPRAESIGRANTMGDVEFFMPRGWQLREDPVPGPGRLDLIISWKHALPDGVHSPKGLTGEGSWNPAAWAGRPERWKGPKYAMVDLQGSITQFPAHPADGRTLLFWSPNSERLPVLTSSLLAEVEKIGLPYEPVVVRHPTKLDLFFRLAYVIIPTTSPQEYRAAEAGLTRAMARYGGSTVEFHLDPAAAATSP